MATNEGGAGCSVCGAAGRTQEYASPRLTVVRCVACGHREARHASTPVTSDYHEHTAHSSRFIESLRATRLRQAGLIIDRLLALGAAPSDCVDFGCGRGWFLEVLESRSLGRCAGFDSSELSLRWLRERGIFALSARVDEPYWPDWSSLPFSPRVVTLLDVLEHYPGDAAEHVLLRFRRELPALEWFVLKVPRAEGVLYRTARLLRNAQPNTYEQLYQVGTFPPHYHYFTTESLRILLGRCGYVIEAEVVDPDVDDLFDRVKALAGFPGGRLAARAIRLFEADSVIAFARVTRDE